MLSHIPASSSGRTLGTCVGDAGDGIGEGRRIHHGGGEGTEKRKVVNENDREISRWKELTKTHVISP